MFLLFLAFLQQVARSEKVPRLSADAPECPTGSATVDAACSFNQKEFPSADLTASFLDYVMNANIEIVLCTFIGFTSTTSDASIISISSSADGTQISITDCQFNQNTLEAPVLSLVNSVSEILRTDFVDNTIRVGALLRLTGGQFHLTTCKFTRNKSTTQISTNSMISLLNSALLEINGCCFLVDESDISASSKSRKYGSIIRAEGNSKVIFTSSDDGKDVTVFNCDKSMAIGGDQISFENSDKVFYSKDKCEIKLDSDDNDDKDNSTTSSSSSEKTDIPDEKDNDEKRITHYVYIGIGSVAVVVVVAIAVVICLRFAGKCKKLEVKSEGELNDMDEKRNSYLLHEEGNETQAAEL